MQYNGNHKADKYFYLHDRLGSVRQILDKDGLVVKYYTFGPFGVPREFGGSLDNPFMFTGQWFDPEIGQYYLRARQYDPILMRFSTRDPVFGQFEEPMSLHKYLYCLNNPINSKDPLGLWAFYVTFTVQAQLIGAGIGQQGIVIDDNGNVGKIDIMSGGPGIGTPACNFGVSFGWSPWAKDMYDLQGEGWASGASFGPLGFEGFVGDNGIGGYEITPGYSFFPIPEGHFVRTHTTIKPKNLNWIEERDMILENLEDAIFNPGVTLGQAEGLLYLSEMLNGY